MLHIFFIRKGKEAGKWDIVYLVSNLSMYMYVGVTIQMGGKGREQISY